MAKICPNCKSENPNNAIFCKECGNELTNSTESKNNFWKNQSSGRKAIIGILGLCCIGIIILLAYGAMFPDKNTSSTIPINNSNDNQSNSNNNVSNFKNYDNNSVMSFQYPKEWVLDFVSSDSKGVYFNSSNGEIRIQIYSTPSDNSQPFETGTLGDWSYKFYKDNGNYVYTVILPDGSLLLVRGPPSDNEGLEKVIETFKIK